MQDKKNVQATSNSSYRLAYNSEIMSNFANKNLPHKPIQS